MAPHSRPPAPPRSTRRPATTWAGRGHPADGSDDEKDLRRRRHRSKRSRFDACAEEPTATAALAARDAAAPTAKKARRATRSPRSGKRGLADLLGDDVGDGGGRPPAGRGGPRFASRYGAAESRARRRGARRGAGGREARRRRVFRRGTSPRGRGDGRRAAAAAHPTSCDRAARRRRGRLSERWRPTTARTNPSCRRCRHAGAVRGHRLAARPRPRDDNGRRRAPRVGPRARAEAAARALRTRGAQGVDFAAVGLTRRDGRRRRAPKAAAPGKLARGRVAGRRARPTRGRRPPGSSGRTTTSSEFRETPAPPRCAGPTGKRP